VINNETTLNAICKKSTQLFYKIEKTSKIIAEHEEKQRVLYETLGQLIYETPAEVYFKQEREACRYVDASFGPASTLRDEKTNHG